VSATNALSERFTAAMEAARSWHGDQVRKATSVTYLSHVLGVAALVLEDGGDEDEAIAAVLHDAVEDTEATVDDVRARFGERVAVLVEACSDSVGPPGEPKAPWRERKESQLARLADDDLDPGALRITAADKLDNLRATLDGYHSGGPTVFERFNAGPTEQLWYYRSVSELLAVRMPGPLAARLERAVGELAALVDGG
jgi:(p)ppGpp synthase/HD superfamily hydrolase